MKQKITMYSTQKLALRNVSSNFYLPPLPVAFRKDVEDVPGAFALHFQTSGHFSTVIHPDKSAVRECSSFYAKIGSVCELYQ